MIARSRKLNFFGTLCRKYRRGERLGQRTTTAKQRADRRINTIGAEDGRGYWKQPSSINQQEQGEVMNMSLVRWSPFREMEALQSEMNRLFSRFNEGSENSGRQTGGQWMLPIDVVETQDALKLKAALPGINPEDASIEVNENVLTINAERRYKDEGEEEGYRWIEQQYGTFTRSVTLPSYADADKIEAHYNNGILELIVPKKESAKPRSIKLQTGSRQPQAIEAGEDKKP